MDQQFTFDEFAQPGPVSQFPQTPVRRWDGGHSLLYFVFASLLSLLAGVVIIGWLGFHLSVVVAEVTAFVAIPLVLRSLFDTGWQTWMRRPKLAAPFWLWCLAAVGSFAIVQSNLPVLLDRVWPIPKEQAEFYQEHLAAASAGEFVLLLLVAAILPGICEEIAFRGLIHTGLRRSFGPNHAIIWGGGMFALLHLNPWNFIGLWTFGSLLGYLRERTGSIYPGMLAHAANNSLALIIFAVQSPEDWTKPPEFLPWFAVLPAGILLIYAVWQIHQSTAPGPLVGGAPPNAENSEATSSQ